MQIRKIRKQDTQDVRKLIDGIMGSEFSDESKAYAYADLDNLTEHYGGNRDVFLVAEKDGKIVGTVAIKEDGPNSALLRRVFVHKDYRGQGYGAKLLNKAVEFCFQHNYNNIVFRGTSKMQNALQLCLKNGFQPKDLLDLGDIKLTVLTRKL